MLEGAAYRHLDALLDHEAHLGTVDLRVRVGSDGELRTFQIVSVRENRDNPFHASPIGRWLARIGLFLRGYRMNGGEVVERIFDDVFTGLEDRVSPSPPAPRRHGALPRQPRLPQSARWRAASRSASPRSSIRGGDARAEIAGLFNPLLLDDKTTPVPCDLRSDHADSVA